MWLHVPYGGADGMRESLQRGDLIHHVRLQLGGSRIDVASSESSQITIGDVRTDRDSARGRGLQRAQHH